AGTLRVPRDSLINTTVAPGMTPPVESWTVPAMVPVVIWADATGAARHAMSSAESTARTVHLNCIYAWPPSTNPRSVPPAQDDRSCLDPHGAPDPRGATGRVFRHACLRS